MVIDKYCNFSLFSVILVLLIGEDWRYFFKSKENEDEKIPKINEVRRRQL